VIHICRPELYRKWRITEKLFKYDKSYHRINCRTTSELICWRYRKSTGSISLFSRTLKRNYAICHINRWYACIVHNLYDYNVSTIGFHWRAMPTNRWVDDLKCNSHQLIRIICLRLRSSEPRQPYVTHVPPQRIVKNVAHDSVGRMHTPC
jgi:hypothetical protein